MKKFEGHVAAAAAVEALMAAGAAGLTAVIWLSVAGVAIPSAPATTLARRANAAPIETAVPAMRYATLPAVVIIGHTQAARMMPATTTAQNTVTNPVTLHQ